MKNNSRNIFTDEFRKHFSFLPFCAKINKSGIFPPLAFLSVATLLIFTLAFHVFVAVTRQLSNNVSSGNQYHKAYPKAVPRIVAWSGASIILIFIVIHSCC